MRFRTRAFLWSFIPFALLLAGSFWMIQSRVQATVRSGLRASIVENDKAMALVRAKSDLQSSRFLRVVGENAALKAGVQLLESYPENPAAKLTVEDQLRELCEHMGFNLLMVSRPDGPPGPPGQIEEGVPLAGVLRLPGRVEPLNTGRVRFSQTGLMVLDNLVFQIASVPLDQDNGNIGFLSVGEIFDFAEFTTPTVLFRNGHVLKSSLAGVSLPDVETAMSQCPPTGECSVRLPGANFISLPMRSMPPGDGYQLRSLQNLDTAVGPVEKVLQRVFGSVALGAFVFALIVSAASAGSIVKPIATVVARLREAEKTGDLVEFRASRSPVREIRGLTESFNRAATSVREGRENLTLAYVEFVQSLAHALDARDPYTAGHSKRVSETASAVARAMGLPNPAVERVRIGALLHDIGKIGVPDGLLRKPGRLTNEEFAIIREHPVIGRHILESVHGFAEFLPAVELHHENWDGSGYPHGQSGETTPLDARIIHVADTFDAMTTDRPYRRGMTREEALRALQVHAGTQFDPTVVRTFVEIENGRNETEHEFIHFATV